MSLAASSKGRRKTITLLCDAIGMRWITNGSSGHSMSICALSVVRIQTGFVTEGSNLNEGEQMGSTAGELVPTTPKFCSQTYNKEFYCQHHLAPTDKQTKFERSANYRSAGYFQSHGYCDELVINPFLRNSNVMRVSSMRVVQYLSRFYNYAISRIET